MTIWDWCKNWFTLHADRKFTVEEVKDLVEKIKEFNAGCIDAHLNRHVDKVLEQWLQDK